MRKGRWLAVLVLAGAAVALWLGLGGGGDSPVRKGVEKLTSLPYLSWTNADTDARRTGVTVLDRARVAPGLNLYASEVAPGARIIDAEGKVVLRLYDHRPEPTPWKLVKPLAGRSFGALAAGGAVLRLDRRSKLLDVVPADFHHDFEVTSDGLLVGSVFRTRRLAAISRLYPIKDDVLTAIEADGKVRFAVSIGDLVSRDPVLRAEARRRPRRLLDWQLDVLHTNTITVLPRDVVYSQELTFPAGSVLTCWRNLDTVAVVDPASERIVWHWGLGELDHPHQPTLLADGNLLIFDNGKLRGYSRVLEVDPRSGEIVWQYQSDPPEGFYSSSRGGAQRLVNGNTLIVESQRGRAFEVTPDGEVVWEFLEPRTRRRGLGGRSERATIYRMQRVGAEALSGQTTTVDSPR
jgi:hypothetical protein